MPLIVFQLIHTLPLILFLSHDSHQSPLTYWHRCEDSSLETFLSILFTERILDAAMDGGTTLDSVSVFETVLSRPHFDHLHFPRAEMAVLYSSVRLHQGHPWASQQTWNLQRPPGIRPVEYGGQRH